MIELVNTTPVTVPVGQSVPFTNEAVKSGCAERHRSGSVQIYINETGKISCDISGNISVPTGTAVRRSFCWYSPRWRNYARDYHESNAGSCRSVF